MPTNPVEEKVSSSYRMSLFRIPNRNDEYSDRGKLWLKLLNADDKDVNQIRICSLHFMKRKPSKADDYLDVDWVPNKNLGEFAKNWKRVEYYIHKKNASRPEASEIANNVHSHVRQTRPRKVINKVEIDEAPSVSVAKFDSKASCFSENQEIMITDDVSSRTNQEFNLRLSLNSLIPIKKRKIMVTEERIFLPKEIQTELTLNDIDLLFEHYQQALEERNELLLKLSTVLIDFNYFKENDKKIRFFTGFTNWKLFIRFFDLVKNFIPIHFNSKLSKFQMIILTLMKLRLNSSFTDLGYRFQIDGNTASRTFHRCIYVLFKKFENSKIVRWPETQNLIFSTPSYFRSPIKDKVTIIVDCFEIFTETPSMLRAAAQLFSHYKHHATIKFLIGISMSGVIIFISKAFGGRTSDKEATIQSGLLDHLKEGDLVLADKGFLIRDLVNARNAFLQLPCFVNKGNQLHPIDVENSRKNSSLRIHVERVIRILRGKFNICSDIAKISALSKQNEIFQADLYDMIIFICSCIVNICPSVVTNEFEM